MSLFKLFVLGLIIALVLSMFLPGWAVGVFIGLYFAFVAYKFRNGPKPTCGSRVIRKGTGCG